MGPCGRLDARVKWASVTNIALQGANAAFVRGNRSRDFIWCGVVQCDPLIAGDLNALPRRQCYVPIQYGHVQECLPYIR